MRNYFIGGVGGSIAYWHAVLHEVIVIVYPSYGQYDVASLQLQVQVKHSCKTHI